MKIALVQQNNKVGDVVGNAARMKAEIARVAEEYGAEVAVFGADAVTGEPLLGLGDSALFREQAAAGDYMAVLLSDRGVRRGGFPLCGGSFSARSTGGEP